MICTVCTLIKHILNFLNRMSTEQFKDRLIAAREALGLSQTQLAGMCQMAPTQLARYENGKAVPRRSVRERLAMALKVNSTWLFNGSEAPDDTEVLVNRIPGEGAELTFRPDPETAKRWKEISDQAGLTPDELFAWMVQASLGQADAAPVQPLASIRDELLKRIEAVEAKLDAATEATITKKK